ncbi:type II secretion system F family protein [bacterium]|nr:type II secretion system F family protein [bacterium]
MKFSLSKKNKDNRKEDEKKEGSEWAKKINDYFLKFSRVSLKEKLFFIQYFGIMFRTGISLSVILRTLSKQTTNKYFAKVVSEISVEVEKGKSLAESFRPHKKIFGDLFINMIEAGEVSGNLEKVLEQLYIQIKKQHELVSKVKGALTYPVVLLMAMILIGVFMMLKVVPQMLGVFDSFGTALPLPTRILIGISDFMVNNIMFLAVVVVFVVLLFIKILKTYKGKYIFQSILLKLPIISSIIKKINLANFARTSSSLMKTDILIVRSFKITASVLGNLPYRKSIEEVGDKIETGGKINEILATYPKLFPPVVQQIVAIGEETGELSNILMELADFYEKEVDSIMSNLPSIIEPVLILLLGVGVGGMAVAIIMPMYSMTSTI